MPRPEYNPIAHDLILRRLAWASGDDRALIARADAPRTQYATAVPPYGVWFCPDGSRVSVGGV